MFLGGCFFGHYDKIIQPLQSYEINIYLKMFKVFFLLIGNISIRISNSIGSINM